MLNTKSLISDSGRRDNAARFFHLKIKLGGFYYADTYIRLSKEDAKNKDKENSRHYDESESVSNQRDIIRTRELRHNHGGPPLQVVV